jgi:hypothetical protein
MKIFISGDIQNYSKAYQDFKTTEFDLQQLGFDVVNPLNYISQHTTETEGQKTRLMLLMDCNAICQMNGWDKCQESKTEFELASRFKYHIYTRRDIERLKRTPELQNLQ